MPSYTKARRRDRPLWLVLLIAVAMVAACAPGPNAVAPAPMPAGLYAGLSCTQARAERAVAAEREAALTARQLGAATGDAVAVLLIGLPVSGLTGGDVSGQLAAERGRLLALDARLSAC
jgi:hypothetical protein